MTKYSDAGFFSLLSFSWVSSFVSKACKKAPQGVDPLEECDADALTPEEFTGESLAHQFNLFYLPHPTPLDTSQRRHKLGTGLSGFTRWLFSWVKTEGSVFRSMALVHSPRIAGQCLAALAAIGIRLASPVALRYYISWLNGQAGPDAGPVWKGCMLAVALGAGAFLLACFQQGPPWLGTLNGFLMRQQAIAVIHAKLLRLNTAAVSAISPGFIINLVSNDVRRFEDASFFWFCAWEAPLELVLAWIMVSLELDFVSATAGIAAIFLLIPLQFMLVRPVANIRKDTAQATDARVRLASEAIQGALACKVLGWEDPLSEELTSLRAKEAFHINKMARIRATNLGVNFIITTIVSFATFAVYRARHGTLNVSSIFYALALLQLPRKSIYTFMQAIQVLTELRVSLQRMQRFLDAHEPPLPLHSQTWDSDGTVTRAARSDTNQAPTPDTGAGSTQPADAPTATSRLSRGTVVMLGARYDWNQPFGAEGPAQQYGTGALDHSVHNKSVNSGQKPPGNSKAVAEGVEVKAVGSRTGSMTSRPEGSDSFLDEQPLTLSGVRFALRRGELLGVCGEVGSGKSSLLAALLGELQPLDGHISDLLVATDSVRRSEWEQQILGHVEQSQLGTALVVGSLAYCAQVPWVVAGTVRDNIVFGAPFDEQWYQQVVHACALEEDIKGLVAGDQTELGERGINLSGGQKARLALARATYQRPDVALLDDPLSAVDPRVGRTLFRECIGPKGMLKGSTRVLVTHQRQYLPLCDRVLVLRGGRPVALASWEQLTHMNLPEIMATVAGGLSLEDADEEEQPQDAVQVAAVPADGANPEDSEDEEEIVAELPLGFDEVSAAQQPSAFAVQTEAVAQPGEEHDDRTFTSSEQRQQLQRSDDSLRGQPLAWMRSFGPHTSGALGGRALSLRRMFSSRRYLRDAEQEADTVRRNRSVVPVITEATPADDKAKAEAAAASGKLVTAEGRALGDVEWRVYFEYFKQMGTMPMLALPVMVVSAQAAYLAADWWLAMWSRSTPDEQNHDKWLWVYGLLTVIVVVLGLGRAFLFFAVSLRASTRVHDAMVSRLLRAPLAFFHTNPAGRVLNRFSKDQACVDDLLPTVFFDSLQCGLLVLGTIVLLAVAVPLVLPVFAPLGLLFVWLRMRYLTASREVKRWEAVTRSPVYATFSSTLKGLATIRAYGVQARFDKELLAQLTVNGVWGFSFPATGRWLGFRLDMVVAITMLCSCLVAVGVRDQVSPALLALALTNLLQMTGFMQWFVRQSAEVENNMTCMERMLEYTRLPQEPPRVREGGGRPPRDWPQSGALRWERVSSRYRPGLPLVLKDISFHLPPNTVCGVVGRTGSGKSSLALTLFRLIDVTSGRVVLDGLDVASIGVDALRSQLAIIPQDPVLFSGTVRSNLDPWGRYEDSALWEVLGSVQMRKAISALGGLSARLAEQGDNLSVGQRQLFCLARALLQNAKVLVLDEATANVDRETDALIHQALDAHVRAKSTADKAQDAGLSASADRGGRVLLVIAHRIDTILDSDHLLVLGAGRLLEQGAPRELAGKDGGVFNGMVAAARLANNTPGEAAAVTAGH